MLKKIDPLLQNTISIHKPNILKHRAQQTIEYVNLLLEHPQPIPDIKYTLFPEIEDRQKVQLILQAVNINLDKNLLIGFQLGCHRVAGRSWKIWDKNRHQHKKVWPLENYVELAKYLKKYNKNIKIVLIGSPNERYLAKLFLAQYSDVIDLIGRTTLLELAALMPCLKTFVTHDTGSLHIACAANTPLIALYGPTSLSFTGPFPPQTYHTIINKSSMAEISILEVYNPTIEILNRYN